MSKIHTISMGFKSYWCRGNHSEVKPFSCKILSIVQIGCGFYNVLLCHISCLIFVNSGSRAVILCGAVSYQRYTIMGGLFYCAA
jgi:hypothetical protein